MSNFALQVFSSGGFDSRNSNSLSIDFVSVIIGSTGLEIKEVSGNLDFGAVKLVNIADGTSNNHAVSKGQMDTALALKQSTSEKGSNNGYAALDGGGKVPITQLPTNLMQFKGAFNATTNSPTLADGTGTAGDTYRVSVAGSQNFGAGAISFGIGDWVFYNGTIWQKADNTDGVTSVNGNLGVVVLVAADLDYTQTVTANWTLADASSIKATLDEVGSRLVQNESDIGDNATAVGDAQTEIDAIEGALGAMISVAGAYVAHSGKNYINGNSDTTEDLIDLDAQIKTNEDAISSLGSPSETFVNGEVGAQTIRKVAYVKQSDGKAYKALASEVNVVETLAMVSDATIAGAASGEFIVTPGSIINGFSAEALGPRYVDPSTEGEMTATPPPFVDGNNVYEVGRFLSATKFLFYPRHITKHVA